MTTLAELRERHKKLIEDQDKGSKGEGGGDWATLAQGDNWVRILPGKSDPLDFFSESSLHKYQDAEGKWKSYHCRKSHNEQCPVCDLYFDLWKRHKALNLPKGQKSKFGDLATKIKVKERFYFKAVIRGLQEKGENPVKFIAASKELFDKIMAALTNPDLVDEGQEDTTTIVSLDRGNDFNVKITKKGEFNSFADSECRIKKTKAGTPKEILEWSDNALDVKTLVKLSDYEEGKKVAMYLDSTLNTVKTESSSTGKPPSEPDEDNSDKFKEGLKV
jgi:hypothetical protein